MFQCCQCGKDATHGFCKNHLDELYQCELCETEEAQYHLCQVCMDTMRFPDVILADYKLKATTYPDEYKHVLFGVHFNKLSEKEELYQGYYVGKGRYEPEGWYRIRTLSEQVDSKYEDDSEDEQILSKDQLEMEGWVSVYWIPMPNLKQWHTSGA